MNQTVLIAVMTVLGSVIGAAIAGYVTFSAAKRRDDIDREKTKNEVRVSDATVADQIRDELRTGWDRMRTERDEIKVEAERRYAELNTKIDALTCDVHRLTDELEGRKTESEASEREAKRSKTEAESAHAEAEGWKTIAEDWKKKHGEGQERVAESEERVAQLTRERDKSRGDVAMLTIERDNLLLGLERALGAFVGTSKALNAAVEIAVPSTAAAAANSAETDHEDLLP